MVAFDFAYFLFFPDFPSLVCFYFVLVLLIFEEVRPLILSQEIYVSSNWRGILFSVKFYANSSSTVKLSSDV